MRYLTTLYVTDHRARITVKAGSIVVVSGDGGRTRVPIETIESVVVVGHAQVTSDALTLCAEKHVQVTSLGQSGRVRFRSGGGTAGNVRLRMAQFQAATDAERTHSVARIIVAGKLQNSQRMMQRWAWDAAVGPRRVVKRLAARVAERAMQLPHAKDGDAIRGLEGDGTRAYFEALRMHLGALRPPIPFETRTRRPPRDAMNAAMSFVYALVLSEIAGGLEGVGLDPQIGFLHGLRPGRPSLALDLIEEFRPSIADRFVVRLMTRHMLGDDAFTTKMGGACFLTDIGRRGLLRAYEDFKAEPILHSLLGREVPRGALPVIQATLMARHLRGDLPAYPPFVMAP